MTTRIVHTILLNDLQDTDLLTVEVRGARGGKCGWWVGGNLEHARASKAKYYGKRYYRGIARHFWIVEVNGQAIDPLEL